MLLDISNSADPDAPKPDTVDVTRGLGSRLIAAFASQLGGKLDQGFEDGLYRVSVVFQISDFKPEFRDY